MYRRLIAGMLACTMAVQLCAGTVHAAEKSGHAVQQTQSDLQKESESASASEGVAEAETQEDAEGAEKSEAEKTSEDAAKAETESASEETAKSEIESEHPAKTESASDTATTVPSEIQSETESTGETQSSNEADTVTESITESESETDTVVESEIKTEIDTEIDTEIESETEHTTETETVSETDLEVECETESETAALKTHKAEPEEEIEEYEEGNPDFLYQAGGFQVMDLDVEARSKQSDDDSITLLSEGDMDQLAAEIYAGLKNRKPSIDVLSYGFNNESSADREQLLMVYYAVVNDHPELYYVRTGYNKSILKESKIISKISPNYYQDIDDTAFLRGVQRAKAAVSADMDDLQTAIALHDYIVLNCEYDKERLANGTMPNVSYGAYGVLAERIAVCQGYALAYKYLLNEFGIDSYIVTSDKMNHAWNIVEIDGALYQVDATWDDPTWDKPGQVRHSYMFQSDTEFQKSYSGHSSHHDWYVTKGSGIVDIQADGTAYDNAFWKTVRSPLVYGEDHTGGQYYYVTSDRQLESRAYDNREIGEAVTLLALETPYSGLALSGSKLYYNNNKNISYLDLEDKEAKEVIRYSLAEDDKKTIYGFTLDGNTIEYAKRASYDIQGISPRYSFDNSKTYTVIFQDKFNTIFDTKQVAEGSYVAPPAKIKVPEGYTFSGWEENYADVRQDETVNAVYKTIPYVISYELNGGINGSSNGVEYNVETVRTLAPPVRDGYDFEGWYTDADYQEQMTAIEKGMTGDLTLYAKWALAEYAITYELGGQADNFDNPAVYTIETDTIQLEEPVRKGYIFEGWYTDSAYLNPVTQIDQGSVGDRTLYAKWEPILYQITYELYEGTNSQKNPTQYHIGMEDIVLQAPTRAHYNFEGWYADTKFVRKVETIVAGSDGDLHLYAKWARKPVYRVRFLDYAGKLFAESEIEEGESASAPGEPDAAIGYQFAQWDKEYTNVRGDLDIKAVYSPIIYTIHYELNGAVSAASNPSTYTVDSADFSLAAPRYTNANLSFAGWYLDKGFQEPITSVKKGTTGDITLYAKWESAWPIDIGTAGGVMIEKMAVAYKDGKVQKPVPTVLWNGKKLANRKDYTVSYAGTPAEIGEYEVIITGKGDFTGTAKTTLSVIDASAMTSMDTVKVTQKIPAQIYVPNGNKIDEKMAVLKNGSSPLTAGRDYEFVQSEYKGAGTYHVAVRGTGSQYIGELTTTFQIKPRSMNDSGVKVGFEQSKSTQPYEKNGAQPKVVISYGGHTLTEGIDYVLSYKNNKKIGQTATVTITGRNNYTDKRSLTFTVGAGTLDQISVTVPDKVANSRKGGFVSVPVVTEANGKKLKAGKDYDSSILYKCDGRVLDRRTDKVPSGKEVTVEFRITGKGSYQGTRNVTCTYKIIAANRNLSKAKATVNHKHYFTGSKVTLNEADLTVTVGGVVLSKNDYEILPDTYVNNHKKGTAKVTIQGRGEYGGTKVVSFKIYERK